jgi:hypothetical protein
MHTFKRRPFLTLLAVSCSVIATAWAIAVPAHRSLPDAGQRVLVLLSLDGFPAYALNDPHLPIPELRALARRGSFARRMQVTNPTVTWPNHTTLVTGVRAMDHGVLFNGALNRNAGALAIDASVDKARLVTGSTLYDAAHKSGLTTAQVAWVAIDRAPSIDWRSPNKRHRRSACSRTRAQRSLNSGGCRL